MKKTSILIAVLAVIAAASAAKAEVSVDFDGNLGAQSIQSSFSDPQRIVFPPPTPDPVPTPFPMPDTTPPPIQDELFSSLNTAVVNGVIQGAIVSLSARGKEDVKTDLENLLKYGTMKEKMGFVYNKKAAYTFPAAIIAMRDTPAAADPSRKRMAMKSQTCMASHNEKVCTQRQVCRVVCAAAGGGAGAALGGGVGAGIGIGAATQICSELCDMLDECVNVTVCDQWVTDPGTDSLTDSHGNYRGRSVDFQN